MDPPPAPPPLQPHHLNYPESLDSSPRSRNTDSWDDPIPPTNRLRLMCSYGGHIVPRPHDKSLCYVGGDTRIVVVDRQTSLSELSNRLSKTLLNGRPFTLKYQLPSEDLDSLISVTTDEDLDNMIDEYERTANHSGASSKPSRLRLFLFPLKPESSQLMGPILDIPANKSEDWFLNALNGESDMLNRGFSDSASVNCLLGLDDDSISGGAANNLDSGSRDVEASVPANCKNAKQGGGGGGGNGQDVHSVPDSPMLENSSSFGSTSSSPSLANLPPIRVHVEDGGGLGGGDRIRVQDQKMGIEEQFARMTVSGGVGPVGQKHDDGGFAVPLKPTLKLVLAVIILGTFLTLFFSPGVYHSDHQSRSVSHPNSDNRLTKKSVAQDLRYVSSVEINWGEISDAIENLTDKRDYQGIGLLNFNDNEIDHWNELLPDCEHVVLRLNHASKNITWETLYPEWIDEEEDFEVPTCPSLPKLQIPGKPRLDLVAVKLPCNKSGSWSRDVARLHLQLEAARLAAASKGYHPVHVLLVTDCFPIPNLFSCKELVRREGNVWLYEPKLNTLRDKLQLPVGSCELSVPLTAKESFYSERAHREAYATIIHSAHVYVCGAIAAAQSIRMSGSTRDLVILVDETISEYHRGGLAAAGWKVHTIQRIRNPKAEPEAYNEWNYSKFRLWQLTDYDKVIFIDADMLILRNIDFLFEMPEISATGNNATLFNSGVMVIEPSNCTFQLLMDHIHEIFSYNGGDQGYLNEVFTWWHRIPKHMNFLKHFWEGDEPEKKERKTHLFAAEPPILYVLHYLGNKPWLCFRDYDCNWNVDFLQEFASNVAHRRWWKVHDAMPQNLQKFCLLRSKQKAALEWDRRQAEKANYGDGHWKIKIKDERLKTCFEDFCFWESMLWHWGEKNWTDNAIATLSPPALTTASVSSS